MKCTIVTIEAKLVLLEKCIRDFNSEMPLSDEGAGEIAHNAYTHIDAIRQALKELEWL